MPPQFMRNVSANLKEGGYFIGGAWQARHWQAGRAHAQWACWCWLAGRRAMGNQAARCAACWAGLRAAARMQPVYTVASRPSQGTCTAEAPNALAQCPSTCPL